MKQMISSLMMAVLAQVCMGCGEEAPTRYMPQDFVTVGPAYSVIEKNESVQLRATMTTADGETQNITDVVTWASANEAVATVSKGQVTGVREGTCEISASFEGMVRSVFVTVEPTLMRLEIAPYDAVTAPYAQAELYAVGIFDDESKRDVTNEATWVSVDPSIVSVAGGGRFTGHHPGDVQVNAIFDRRGAMPHTLTVEDASLDSMSIGVPFQTLPVGKTMRLSAMGSFDAGGADLVQEISTVVTWEIAAAVGEKPVAEISNDGLLTGLHPGSVDIIARWSHGGVARTSKVAVDIDEYELTAIAIHHDGDELDLFQMPLTGEPADLTVQGIFKSKQGAMIPWDITSEIKWKLDGKTIRRFGSSIHPYKPGKTQLDATISVKNADGELVPFTDTITVDVVDAPLQDITITERNPRSPDPSGTQQPFTARATFSDSINELVQDVTAAAIWETDKPNYVVIDNIGPDVGVAQIIAQPSPGEETTTVTVHARYRGSDGTYTLSLPPAAGE